MEKVSESAVQVLTVPGSIRHRVVHLGMPSAPQFGLTQ